MTEFSERVLVLDSVAGERQTIAGWLSSRGLEVDVADRLAGPELARYGLVVLDVDLLQSDWSAQLSELKRSAPETEVILTTQAGEGSVEAAVSAIREGAYDYLVKPLDPNRLPVLAHKALERRRLSEENRSLRQRLSMKDEYGNVVGKSRSITEVYEVAGQVAGTAATALLTGESGTGKELVAKAIHKRSARRDRPFVSINCGALPEGLLESELFGFERGAFTGAFDSKPGKFELADGGTLFLDEVGEMSAKTQVEFLRVLQEREFRRVGGNKLIRVDVRIIAATNKDLLEEVHAGRFRQDLYYRLAVVPIHLPSLRERREDIPLLVDTFLREFAVAAGNAPKRVSRDAMQALSHYHWPGNIRELRNVIERLTVTVHASTIRREHLPDELTDDGKSSPRQIFIRLGTPLRKVEEIVIRRTLEELTDHRQKAASILGISPRALHYKIARYGVPKKRSQVAQRGT
jgi:DNA-binding NtrC family response regulator